MRNLILKRAKKRDNRHKLVMILPARFKIFEYFDKFEPLALILIPKSFGGQSFGENTFGH